MRKYLFIICLALLIPASALAGDVVATYKYQDGSMMTVCVRDAQHVRMDTSPTSYTLLKGDKVYAVSQQDGQWQVIDMDQMKGAASGVMSMFGGGDASDYSASYTKTGRTEKVAGYTGVVYNAELREGGKVTRRDEVVLSTHADIKKVNEGWIALAARMGQIMGGDFSKAIEQATAEAKDKGYGGMLRYGDEMRLSSLKKPSLAASYYDLPSGSQQVQMNDDGSVSDELGQDAKDVGRAAKDEAKDSTVEGVREGVRDMFKSIF